MQTEYETRHLLLAQANNALLAEILAVLERCAKMLEARPVDGRKRGGK